MSYILTACGLFFVALLIRIFIGSNLVGFMTDQGYFISWMKSTEEFGIRGAYLNDNGLNYPPIFVFLLMLYNKTLHLLGFVAVKGQLSIKLPGIIIDQVAVIIFAWLNKRGIYDLKKIWIFIFFALNPALIYDSAVWGQVDMLHGLLMALCLVLLIEKPGWAGVIFALAVLTKFQSIMIIPVIAVYFLKQIITKEWRDSARFVGGFLIPTAIIFIFFALKGALNAMIHQAYIAAYGLFKDVTLSATNIWFYLIGTTPEMADTNQILPGITLSHVGLTLLSIALFFIMWFLYKSDMSKVLILKAGSASVFSFYMLSTEMHDRYIIPVLIIALTLLIFDKSWLKISIGLTVTTFFTLLMVTKTGVNPTKMWIVYLNCSVFYLMIKDLWNTKIKRT